MSRWYLVDTVLILNWMTWPMFTLIAVAKPWIDALPAPESHTDCGVPGWLFSHATLFTIGEHGSIGGCGGSSWHPVRTSNERANATHKLPRRCALIVSLSCAEMRTDRPAPPGAGRPAPLVSGSGGHGRQQVSSDDRKRP